MSASDEIMKILHQIWSKLQGLSQDHPLIQAAFFIIILFILTFIVLLVMGCVFGSCCCRQGTKNRVSAV